MRRPYGQNQLVCLMDFKGYMNKKAPFNSIQPV